MLSPCRTDNDSDEDVAPKAPRKEERKAAEALGEASAAGGEEDSVAEDAAGGEADDEVDGEEEDEDLGDLTETEEDSGSGREQRQGQPGAISSRSESKPYSSVTHKCEVRNACIPYTVVEGNQVH